MGSIVGRVRSAVLAVGALSGLILLVFVGCSANSVLADIQKQEAPANGGSSLPTVATPTFSPGAGTYSVNIGVTLSDSTTGATIYYTVTSGSSGTTPTTSSNLYSGSSIAITGSTTGIVTETIEAVAIKSGMPTSGVASATYVINYNMVSTPNFSPVAGTYTTNQSVQISDLTSGATIYYTVTAGSTGTTPTTSSLVYGGTPISVTGSSTSTTVVTIEAMGVKSGMTTSNAASATYTISYPPESAPTFTPTAGTYFTAQNVTINESDSAATIYYTTNGTTPTTSSTKYSPGSSTAIAVNASPVTIKAMAVSSATSPSPVVSGSFSAMQLAKWAGSQTTTGNNNAYFTGSVVDASGNIYAVGDAIAYNTMYFGNNSGASIAPQGGGDQALLVKYNTSGGADWAAVSSTIPGDYNGAALDSSGNIYVVGDLGSSTAVNFGNGVTVTPGSSQSLVLVKYNSNGTAAWAKSTLSAGFGTTLDSVRVDTAGNIDVAGQFILSGTSTGSVYLGNNVYLNDPYPSQNDEWFLVQYSPNGTPQWAKTFAGGTSGVKYATVGGLALDSSGNIYLPINVGGAGTYNFGNGVSATGGSTGGNAVLVKFNSSGTALWAAEKDSASYWATAVSSSGSVLVTGEGTTVLAAYSSGGSALWAQSTSNVTYHSITLDGSGNIYLAGTLSGTARTDFGNSVFCAGVYSGLNLLVAKYNSAGQAQWAQSAVVSPYPSIYLSVGVDSSNNVFTVGWMGGQTSFGLGNGVSVSSGGLSGVLVAEY